MTDSSIAPSDFPPPLASRRVNRKLILWLTIILIVFTVVFLRFSFKIRFYPTSTDFIRIGQDAEMAGEVDKATQYYGQAIRKEPGNPEGYNKLATLYIKQDELEKAGKLLRTLVENHPAHKDGLVAILNLAAPEALNRYSPETSSLVERWVDQLLRVEPNNALGLRIKASLAFTAWNADPEKNAAQLREAMKFAEGAIAADPKDSRTLLLLALIYHHTEKPEKIPPLFEKFPQTAGGDPLGPLTYASFLVTIGQLPKARQQIDSVLQTYGNNPKVLLSSARLYDMIGDREKSRLTWQKLREIEPTNAQPNLALAQMLLAQGKFDEVIEVCKDGLERISTNKRLLNRMTPLRGELMLRRGMAMASKAEKLDKASPERETLTDAAEEDLKTVTLDRGPQIYSLILAGQISLLRGRNAEAIGHFEEARMQMPAGQVDVGLMVMLGQLYNGINQPGKALQLFKDAAAAAPTQPLPLRASAELYLLLDKAPDAEVMAKKLLELTPEDPAAKRLFISTVLAQGRQGDAQNLIAQLHMADDVNVRNQLLAVQLRSGKPEEILSSFRNLIGQRPQDANLREQYIRYLFSQQDAKGAQAELKSALEQLPNAVNLKLLWINLNDPPGPERNSKIVELAEKLSDPFARAMMLYTVTRNSNNLAKAAEYLDQAATIQPDNPQLLEEQLTLYITQKEWDKAEQVVKRAERLNVDGAKGAFYRGRWFSAQGRHQDAISTFEAGLRKFPNSSSGLTAYGEALFRMGSTDEAIESFRRALEQNPRNAMALKGMAMAYMPSNPALAVNIAHQALGLAPDDPWLLAVDEEARDLLQPLDQRINARLEKYRAQPENMPNVQALARLMFKTDNAQLQRQGEQILLDYVQRNQNSLPVLVQLCQRLIATRRGWQAESLLQGFIGQTKTPQDRINASLMLARLYNDLKRFADAEKVYADLITQNTNDPALYAELSECLAAQGKNAQALDHLRTAVSLPDAQSQQYQALVRMLVENKKFDEAGEIVNELAQKYPKDEKLPWLRALLAINHKQPEEAVKQLANVISKNPEDQLAIWQRAQLYSERGDMALAIHDLETLKQINPKAFNFKPQLLLLDLLERTGEMVKAKMHATKLIEETKDNSDMQLAIALWLYRTSNYKEAASLIQTGTAANPTDWRWRLIKGQTCLVQGELTQARDELIEANRLNDRAATAVTTLGQVYIKLNQPDQAIRLLEQAQTRKIDDAVCASLRVIAYLMSTRYPEAQAEINRNLVKVQRGEDLFTLVAQMMATLGDKASYALLDKWMAKSADDPLPPLIKASFLVSQGKIAPSLELLNKIDKAIAPEDPLMVFYLRVLGISQQQLKKFKEAEICYRKLLKLAPQDAVSLNNLSYMLANDMNRPEEAIPFIERAREVEPDNANILDTQGIVMLKSGRLDDSERALRMSLRLAEFPENRYHMGLLRMARKDWPGARIELEKGLQLLETKNARQESIRNQIQDALETLE